MHLQGMGFKVKFRNMRTAVAAAVCDDVFGKKAALKLSNPDGAGGHKLQASSIHLMISLFLELPNTQLNSKLRSIHSRELHPSDPAIPTLASYHHHSYSSPSSQLAPFIGSRIKAPENSHWTSAFSRFAVPPCLGCVFF